ncbi:MAG: hypothetical protein Q8K46_03300, partial [Deltaproteobacteria bacterium]|nr:hypothetical protein [Deltaproteobacteria bacterium]
MKEDAIMALYPFPEALQNLSKSTTMGNFGLWYNKYIPLSNAYKPADENGKDTMPVEHYFARYGQMKRNAAVMLNQLLKQKHADMDDFCTGFPSDKYEEIVICATLTTP